jgi:hypothetical protein
MKRDWGQVQQCIKLYRNEVGMGQSGQQLLTAIIKVMRVG